MVKLLRLFIMHSKYGNMTKCYLQHAIYPNRSCDYSEQMETITVQFFMMVQPIMNINNERNSDKILYHSKINQFITLILINGGSRKCKLQFVIN